MNIAASQAELPQINEERVACAASELVVVAADALLDKDCEVFCILELDNYYSVPTPMFSGRYDQALTIQSRVDDEEGQGSSKFSLDLTYGRPSVPVAVDCHVGMIKTSEQRTMLTRDRLVKNDMGQTRRVKQVFVRGVGFERVGSHPFNRRTVAKMAKDSLEGAVQLGESVDAAPEIGEFESDGHGFAPNQRAAVATLAQVAIVASQAVGRPRTGGPVRAGIGLSCSATELHHDPTITRQQNMIRLTSWNRPTGRQVDFGLIASPLAGTELASASAWLSVTEMASLPATRTDEYIIQDGLQLRKARQVKRGREVIDDSVEDCDSLAVVVEMAHRAVAAACGEDF